MSEVIEQILIDEWNGCYRGGWKGVICDDAFAHPAKVAFKLAERIYEHAIEEGWIQPKDVVVDPFGGIGGCAFHGLMNGMIVVTNELEEKFVNLSKQNRELWCEKFTGLPGFDADNWIILQGDSRRLSEVIREAGLSVSSPPYADGCAHRGGDDPKPDMLQGGDYHGVGIHLGVSSPPYANDTVNDRNGIDLDKVKKPGGHNSQSRKMSNYGAADGQLGRMTVSSPPFPQPYTSGGGINQKGYGDGSDKVGDRTYQSKGGDRVEGNLETMKDGGFDVAISRDSGVKVEYNSSHAKELQNEHAPANGNHREDVRIRTDELRDSKKTQDQSKFDSTETKGCRSDSEQFASDQSCLRDGRTDAAELLEGQEAAEGNGQEASSENLRPEPLELQRRQGERGLPLADQKGEVRTLSIEKGFGDSPQRPRSLQQRSGKSSGALQELSPTSTQADLLGREETGQDPAEVERTDSLDAEICISSPPYEGSEGTPSLGSVNKDDWGKDGRDIAGRRGLSASYGEHGNNIGKTTGDTFWAASRIILEQLYSVLTPGAHAIFIVKAFVRDKKIVDFPGQWAQLCEAAGFRLIHDHHAMLGENYGTQGGMFGEDKEYKVKRVSFFRRLHERRSPETEIHYENVLCFERPIVGG